MTFEELEQITIEQDKRIFSFECVLEYIAGKNFNNNHFKELHRNYINYACWEVMLKIKFPFEQIIPQIEFVHSVKDTTGATREFITVSLRFSLYILNLPGMTVTDLSSLSIRFLDTFDDILTHFYKLPMEIKTSTMLLEMSRSHSLFASLRNDNSF